MATRHRKASPPQQRAVPRPLTNPVELIRDIPDFVAVSSQETRSKDKKFVRFKKSDFRELEVIGQFNKGFVICQRKDGGDQVMVVDQHAADEKTNYERLHRDICIETQALALPKKIRLDPLIKYIFLKFESDIKRLGFRWNFIGTFFLLSYRISIYLLSQMSRIPLSCRSPPFPLSKTR